MISLARKIMNFVAKLRVPDYEGLNWKDLLMAVTGLDLEQCVECLVGRMVIVRGLPPPARG